MITSVCQEETPGVSSSRAVAAAAAARLQEASTGADEKRRAFLFVLVLVSVCRCLSCHFSSSILLAPPTTERGVCLLAGPARPGPAWPGLARRGPAWIGREVDDIKLLAH
ncbi:unnamed protein product [Pylaiella littoralis]